MFVIDRVVRRIVQLLRRGENHDEEWSGRCDENAPWTWAADDDDDRPFEFSPTVAGMIARTIEADIAKRTGQPVPGDSPDGSAAEFGSDGEGGSDGGGDGDGGPTIGTGGADGSGGFGSFNMGF